MKIKPLLLVSCLLLLMGIVAALGLVDGAGSNVYAGQLLQTTPTPLSPVVLTADGEISAPGTYNGALEVEGYVRSYLLYVPPSYDANTPTPLVVTFHGYTDIPDNHIQYTNLIPKADEAGFLLLVPRGQGNPPAWFTQDEAEVFFLDDVLFTRQLIQHLQGRLNIDPRRIFASGMSNGGGMAGRVGCDMADVFAAIAPVSANHFYGDSCTPLRPVPVLVIHGRLDEITPYEGRKLLLANIPAWTRDWVNRNECIAEPEVSTSQTAQDPPRPITVEHWSGCRDNADVWLYTYEEMGHAYPSNTAPDLMWDFFATHPLPEAYLTAMPTTPIVVEQIEEDVPGVPPGDYLAQVNVDGRLRPYLFHVPQNFDATQPTPLVISLHGFTSNPAQHAEETGWTAKSEAEGFVVVYPGGTGEPPRWTIQPDAPLYQNDLEFFEQIIDNFQRGLNIDPNRVYLVGFSLGASMAERLVCETPEKFAAVALVSGAYFRAADCQPATSLPLLAMHGDADSVVPYEGNDQAYGFAEWGVVWAERNGCMGAPATFTNSDGQPALVWAECGEGAPVSQITVPGGDHEWPANATRLIWQFFVTQNTAAASQ